MLITGASGFVGSAVLRALAGKGLNLRALVRPSSPRDNLAGIDCEIVEGDMRHAGDVCHALDGVRGLFHVAADYRLWARDPLDIVRANLDGARTVMEAALSRRRRADRLHQQRRHPARRRTGRPPIDETAPLAEGEAIGAYKQSKVAAERLVERLVAERGLPAVIVMPSTPIGPRDIKPTPTGRIVVEAAHGHDAGLRRHRPQPGPRRRRRRRPSDGDGHAAGSASATSWAARTSRCARCWPAIAGLTGRKPPDREPAARRRSIPWPGPPRAIGPDHRQGADR